MNIKLATALIALTLPLAGCGNKGPLVLAEPPASIESPDTPAGEVPVELAPETTGVPADEVPTSELEPVDTAPVELPIDPATVPETETETDPGTTPVEPLPEPPTEPTEPVEPTTDDDSDG